MLSTRGEPPFSSAVTVDLRQDWLTANDSFSWHVRLPGATGAIEAAKLFASVPLKGNPPGAGHLSGSLVVQAGLGAVGGECWETLARSGVAALVGVDPDDYGDESVLTQPIFWRHRGQHKARVQGDKARRINPAARVCTAVGYAEDLPLWLLRAATVLVVAGDSEDLLLWAARVGAALAKPVVQGAVHGETGTAIVRGFAFTDQTAACPRCVWGQPRQPASAASCDPSAARSRGGPATRTLPAITALAGQLLGSESLKWCTGAASLALRGEECTYSLWTHRSLRTQLPRREGCSFAHERWVLCDLPRPHHEMTIEMLIEHVSGSWPAVPPWVRAEVPWFASAVCGKCGAAAPVRRFARLGAPVGVCSCGAGLLADRQSMHEVVPRADLCAVRDRSLAQLGLGPDRAIGVLDGEQWAYFFPHMAAV
jgi:molybdopterin/thiamine biosynthesis adenylyltransferase